jgi:peptidoglycan hydrolase-like protein with peptidoglycan-binding domain
VQWLASQLANISGRELSRNGMISYDAGLIKEVKNFQMQEGLETDGIAGAQTLIRLNSVLQKDVPRLTGSNTSPRSDKQSAGAIDSQSGQIVAQLSALKE